MSKISIDLKYKDLYAIKHALELQIDKRQAELFNYEDDEDICVSIQKDLDHEQKVLKYVTDVISKYK